MKEEPSDQAELLEAERPLEIILSVRPLVFNCISRHQMLLGTVVPGSNIVRKLFHPLKIRNIILSLDTHTPRYLREPKTRKIVSNTARL